MSVWPWCLTHLVSAVGRFSSFSAGGILRHGLDSGLGFTGHDEMY